MKIEKQLDDARKLASLNSSSSLDEQEGQERFINHELRKKIMDEDGQLNASAFNKLLQAKEAGKAKGHRAFLVDGKRVTAGFVQENHLLQGLAVAGITAQELQSANMRHYIEGANDPVPQRFNSH